MFVGRFIGSPKMNFVAGTVTEQSKGSVDVSLDGYDGVSVKMKRGRPDAAMGTKVMIGIRPEHFSVTGETKLGVKVNFVENLGSTSFAYVSGPDGTDLTVEVGDLPVAAGSDTSIGFDAAQAFLFDTERASGCNAEHTHHSFIRQQTAGGSGH